MPMPIELVGPPPRGAAGLRGVDKSHMAVGDYSQVVAENPEGAGPFVILCDHASNRIPEDCKSFGYAEDALETHIAWDPGALGVARHLSARFDAPLFWPDVSRLVIDCNRAPDAKSLIVTESEGRPVPANRHLTEAERSAAARPDPRSLSCRDRCMPRAPPGRAAADRARRDPLLYPGLFRKGAPVAGWNRLRRRSPPCRYSYPRTKGRPGAHRWHQRAIFAGRPSLLYGRAPCPPQRPAGGHDRDS